MLDIRRSGNMADVIASVRDVPARIVPYAASTALTRTAQFAVKTELPAEMRSVFGNPVAYTLNALRIEPATKDTLSARVMVKTSAAGVAPENFLFPQVEGGGRKHKRAEAGMRYAGVLGAGQFAMPGAGLNLDANGNVKGADVRTILTALKGMRAVSSARNKQRKGRQLANDLFVGTPNGGTFTVVAPDGYSLGTVAVGATFSTQIKFSITDGSTDFIVGDRFNITVAAGLGGFVQSLSAASDGSQVPEAILAEDTDATLAPAPTIAYTRGDFIADDVIFGTAHTVDSTRAVLRDKGIFLIGQVPV